MSAPRPSLEASFTTHDGVPLFYQHWPAERTPRRGAIVIFHRGHEHSGRMAHLASELDLPDFDFFAWDARGHGRSPGVRGFSPSLACSVRDVNTFVRHIESSHGVATDDMVILGQSIGAVLVGVWAHDYATPVRCLVLASPAFKVKLYVPFAVRGLSLAHRLLGNFFVSSYVKSRFLTRDVQRQESYDADPLISRSISVNMLLDLYRTAPRIIADAQAITAPTLLLISEKDWVVHHAPQHEFFSRLGSSIKEKHVLTGFLHDTFGEYDRRAAINTTREFVLRQFAAPLYRPDLRAADQHGAMHDEAVALSRPLSLLSPRGLYWSLSRLNIRFGSLWSAGLRLGRQTGFDSGSSLDYVYRNKPTGHGIVGRLIDKIYLNAIGWRGIRQRKQHIMELLCLAMDNLYRDRQAVRILDIAAGHGRYIFDAFQHYPRRPESIRLRDFDNMNVKDGTALIRASGFEDIAQFVAGDAFDAAELAATAPPASVGIVSGLYELFPENDAVRRSLFGLSKAIGAGGYLIYTGQPWHPQLELIARSLTSHRGGKAWIMRRRTQAEMDQLVAEAGFEKLEQRIDEWGIFTVALAQRRPA